ncbi:MAG: hypothetical protein EOP05_16610 [Proteobacteria bacterium]|nr:MAG: hypothetical protein EOP05_16610 [Pseudomonadota bacterium]
MKSNFKTVSLLVGGLILLGVAMAWIWTLRTSAHQNGWHAGVVQQAKPEIVKADFYLSKIQPVFSARCIACHSCMNSPCQLDLTSYEGLQRGASKVDPYNFPLLETNATTRIGIDAHTEAGWRKKGFHSVLDGNEKSILAQFLDPKNFKAATDAKPAQSFHAESSRMCPSSEPAQLKAYFDANPQGEMPFGFPAIEANSREVISKWISEGARGPSAEAVEAMSLPSTEKGKKIVADWETYLNRQSFKERLVARYIYEHLFIAHVHFDGMPGEFFRLIRARNVTGTPDEISTRRPYDDPGKEKFYYRFKKFTQELVAKTHLPYELGEKRRERYEELFFKSKWEEGPDTFPIYGPEASNAFMVYKRIPAESRYRFLLDDAYYHIGNFIKGPVCRGQTALNVINDQFWVMFIDPSRDTN